MKPFQTLRPLVQLVPAAAVAAAVFLTLPRTEPVLAAVPERLTPPVETACEAAVEEAPEEEVLPRLPYPDGVYTGSARGYGGPVKVQVTMENGTITGVEILNASHETAAFLKRARRLLNTVVTAQTWEVDAVSEATYTSRGILGAVQNALTGEVVNNPAPPQPEPAEPPVVETFTPPSAYRDGVYTASAPGYGGPITVQVTVQSDVITDIAIVSHDGETTSYFSRARKVVSDILERGTPEVDAVSGATYSSTGILNAVQSALAKAAADAEPEAETPAESEVPDETPELPAEAGEPDASGTAASEEAPAASEPAEPETGSSTLADFWEQAGAALSALFERREPASESVPDVIFRAAPPEEAASPETEAAEPAAETPAESQLETEPASETPAESEGPAE